MTTHTIRDKIVFITGASAGIGAACAEHAARQGARLLLCARRLEPLESLAQRLQSEYNVKAHVFQLDVRRPQEVQAQWEQLPSEWKAVDVLINNAGLARGLETLEKGNPQDWDEMIDTNIKGLLYVSRCVIPEMVLRKKGHIINLGSVSAHEVYPKGGVYCATKHAVRALSNTMRMELAESNIRVTEIDPGSVQTEFSLIRFNGDQEKASKIYEGYQALQANDIAEAMMYALNCPPHVTITELKIMPTERANGVLFHRSHR